MAAAAEVATPESTFLMEKEEEEKAFDKGACSIQIDKFSLIEKKQEDALLDKSQESIDGIRGSNVSSNDEENTEEESKDFTKEQYSKEDSSPQEDVKIDPEVLHSSSDSAENVFKEGDGIPVAADFRNNSVSKELDSVNSAKLEDDIGTTIEDSQESTILSLEVKLPSNELEILQSSSKDNHNSSGENPEPIRQVFDVGNKTLEEVVEANICETSLDKAEGVPEHGCNQSILELEQDQAENLPVEKTLEIVNHKDSLHASMPHEVASEEDSASVTSIQELGTKSIQEEILEAQRTDEEKNVTDEVKEEKMPTHDESSTVETNSDFGVAHNQDNSEEYINKTSKDGNLSPEESNQDVSESNLTLEEEHHENSGNAGEDRRPEPTKGDDDSIREFETTAQALEVSEEANNIEQLDVDQSCYVNSTEIPEEEILLVAKDVRGEKEASTPEESEEIKEDLAYSTTLVSGASEQHVEDQSLGKSDMYSHEEPQETIGRTSHGGFCSEEVNHVESSPELELQTQTTEPEEESIISPAENGVAEKAETSAQTESQDHNANVLVNSGEIQSAEYHEADEIVEGSENETTSIEAHVETNDADASPAAEGGYLLEKLPSTEIPSQEETVQETESKNDCTTDKHILYETSEASLPTIIMLLQNQESKTSDSDDRGGSTKEIEEDEGTEVMESESQGSLSLTTDPLEGKVEKREEPAIEEKRDGENREITRADGEHLAVPEVLETENQTNMKDDTDMGATEQLSSSEEFSKEAEITNREITRADDEHLTAPEALETENQTNMKDGTDMGATEQLSSSEEFSIEAEITNREITRADDEHLAAPEVLETENQTISMKDDTDTGATEQLSSSEEFSKEAEITKEKHATEGKDASNPIMTPNQESCSNGKHPESIRPASDLGNESLEEVVEGNICETVLDEAEKLPEVGCNQSIVEPEETHTENLPVEKALEIVNDKDPVHASMPLEVAGSGEDSPSLISIQEQNPKIVQEENLEAERTNENENIIEVVKEEKMATQHTENSTVETSSDYGAVHNQNNTEDFKQDISVSNLTLEERGGNSENAEVDAKPELIKGDDELIQEFQITSQANEGSEEQVNNEIPEAVIPKVEEGVWEQKEDPMPKEADEELAYSTNSVSEASEQHVDNKSIGTSEIYLHEKPEETIKIPSADFSNKEEDHMEPLPEVESQSQTTEPDKESVISPLENVAAEKAETGTENQSLDHSANVLVNSGEILSAQYHDADKNEEGSKNNTFDIDPESTTVEAVVQPNAADASTAAAPGVLLEEVPPPMEIPNQEELVKVVERESDGKNIDEDITYLTSDASCATIVNETLLQNEDSKISDDSGGPTKVIEEEHNGKGILSVTTDPSDENLEKSEEPAMEEKREQQQQQEEGEVVENLKSENMITDGEQIAVSQSVETENQADETLAEATEHFSNSEEFREETEITKEKYITEEKDASTPIINPTQEAVTTSDNSVEEIEEQKIINHVGSFETQNLSDQNVAAGSSQVSIREEVADYSPVEEKDNHLQAEMSPEVHPGTKMPSDTEVIEEPDEISAAKETTHYCAAEENEESKQEDPEGKKADEIKYSADGSEKLEELTMPDIDQNSLKQFNSDEEKVAERPGDEVSILEQIAQNSSAEEEKEEKNVNETNKIDELKPVDPSHSPEVDQNKEIKEDMVVEEPSQVSTEEGNAAIRDASETQMEEEIVQETPKSINNASETTKYEEHGSTEAAQRLNTEMEIQDNEVETPIAEEALKIDPAEESHEERNANDTTGVEVEVDEISKITEDTSQITKLQETDVIDATHIEEEHEQPCQISTAENPKNYAAAEEGKEEGYAPISSEEDDQKSETYKGVEDDEISKTIHGESQMEKVTDAKQMTSEDKFVIIEEPQQVLKSEELADHSAQEYEGTNFNDSAVIEEFNQQVDPDMKANETSECQVQVENKAFDGPPQISDSEETGNANDTTPEELNQEVVVNQESEAAISNLNESTKLEETDTIGSTQSLEDQVHEEPSPPIAVEKTINCGLAEEQEEKENVADSATEDDLSSELSAGIVKHEISETINYESPSTKMTVEDEVILIEEHHRVSTSEEVVKHSLPEDERENTNDTAPAVEELNQKKDPELGANEISETTHYENESIQVQERETSDAPEEEEKVATGPSQSSNVEDMVNYEAIAEQQPVNNGITSDESKPEVTVNELSNSINNSNECTKLEEPETNESKSEEATGVSPDEKEATGVSPDEKEATGKLEEYQVMETEPEKPEYEAVQDFPHSNDLTKAETSPSPSNVDLQISQDSPHDEKEEHEVDTEDREATNQVDKSRMEIAQEDDPLDLTETNDNSGTVHVPFENPVAVPDLEFTANEVPGTGIEAKIASQDEEDTEAQKGQSDETLQPEIEPEDASKDGGNPLNSSPQESSLEDEENKSEKVEEQGKLSTDTRETNVHQDENEDKKIQIQDQYPSLMVEQDSARDVSSEPNLKEITEAGNQNTKTEAEQKENLVDLTDSEATNTPLESTKDKIAREEEEERSTPEKCQSESPQLEIQAKKLEDASEAVAKAESGFSQESNFEGDKENMVEEEANLSRHRDAAELNEDEVKNEKLHDQAEIQTQIDNSSIKVEQKDDQAGLTNSDATDTPIESTIAMSDSETKAKEDPKTGPDTKIPSQAEATSLERKGPTAETLQPESKVSDAEEETSKAQAEAAVAASSFQDDKKEEEKVEDQSNHHPSVATECEPAIEAKEGKANSETEEASVPSLQDLLQVSRNANSTSAQEQLKNESVQTVQREEKEEDGTTEGALACDDEPKTEQHKDEEVREEETKRNAEAEAETDSTEDNPVMVETSRDAAEEALIPPTHKKSHNLLSGVGSKVKHSIAKVKKVITGKSSQPKPSSPK